MSRQDEPATKRDLDRLETKINDVEKRLTAKIDSVDQRLTSVEERLTAKIDAVDQRLTAKIDANAAGIAANAAMLSRVAAKVVENSEKITQLTAKVDKFDGYFNRIMITLDGLAVDYGRVNQEQTATNARLDRVESDVGKNKRDIKKIKAHLFGGDYE